MDFFLLEIVQGVQKQNLAQSHQNLPSHQGLLICWFWYHFFSGMLLMLSQDTSSCTFASYSTRLCQESDVIIVEIIQHNLKNICFWLEELQWYWARASCVKFLGCRSWRSWWNLGKLDPRWQKWCSAGWLHLPSFGIHTGGDCCMEEKESTKEKNKERKKQKALIEKEWIVVASWDATLAQFEY